MGGLRTILAALGAATLLTPPAGAEPLDRAFAHCAGRYAALTEHLWTVAPPDAAEAERRRDLFLDLVAATAPAPAALNWRVEAKAAQRGLLETATWGTGPRAALARARAAEALDSCDRLLLGQ